ncbi:MAG: FdhC protein [Treponema sp.]|nr:MAG: FdhC protein [Treponema sp.]
MSEKMYLPPNEILDVTIESGVKKVGKPLSKQFVFGILAGAFIGFAASASNMASYGLLANPETYGLGKFVAGLLFPVGLMFVLIAGADLFTGNNLIFVATLKKRVSISGMLKNWLLVYIGNFLGAVLIAGAVVYIGQLSAGKSMLGGLTIKIAYSKVTLQFGKAFVMGILCNWIVCLSVWMSYGAKDMAGKLLTAFFPIWLFVTSGFEHSVANMYYVPAGIFAKSVDSYVQASHISESALQALNWGNFFVKNLVPVTLGNIVGGVFFVGLVYWFCFSKKAK